MQNKIEHPRSQKIHSERENAHLKRARIEDLAARLKAYLIGESNDESAFVEFAHIFVPKLTAYFRRKGLTPMEAADLAENSATDIVLKADHYQYRESGGFQAWVFKLALHAISDWFERRLPTVSLSESLPPSFTDNAKAERRRFARALPDGKVMAAVQDAMAQLKPRDRQLIELRNFIADHSYEEIACQLQRSPNALSTQHHRLLKKLKAILERDPRMQDRLNRAKRRTEKEG